LVKLWLILTVYGRRITVVVLSIAKLTIECVGIVANHRAVHAGVDALLA